MLFPNDLKVDRESNLWLLTDKLPTHIYKKLNYNEINYRIFKGAAMELVKGTSCEVKASETSTPGVTISTETSVKQSNSTSV